jgi:5-(carboxyamino)imidazole ribonucleotide mutase
MMTTKPTIGIIMGSQSDWPTLKYSADILDEFDVVYETKIVSAHRTPIDFGNTVNLP